MSLQTQTACVLWVSSARSLSTVNSCSNDLYLDGRPSPTLMASCPPTMDCLKKYNICKLDFFVFSSSSPSFRIFVFSHFIRDPKSSSLSSAQLWRRLRTRHTTQKSKPIAQNDGTAFPSATSTPTGTHSTETYSQRAGHCPAPPQSCNPSTSLSRR